MGLPDISFHCGSLPNAFHNSHPTFCHRCTAQKARYKSQSCERAKICRRTAFLYQFELISHRMKKWIACILSFYILFSALVPCSVIDHCGDEEQTRQSSHSEHKKDCNNCSPFSICSSAPGFPLYSVNTSLEPIAFYNRPAYSEYYFASRSAYYASLFQPPRFG
jgi:hypothetical protein